MEAQLFKRDNELASQLSDRVEMAAEVCASTSLMGLVVSGDMRDQQIFI